MLGSPRMTTSWVDRGHGALYVLSQRLVGADLARKACIDALAPRAGDRILDIGCGPAYYFDWLPPCEYHGFDTDRRQIAAARARFGGRGEFYDETYGEAHAARLAPFDGVLLLGLLHHVDDDDARSVLDLVARSVRPGGRVVTLDTVLYEGQPRLARLLAKNDKGDHIRHPKAFRRLAERSFSLVDGQILGGTARMPAALYMMTLEGPITSRSSPPG
jgi:SAM-dependent methyltransferase